MKNLKRVLSLMMAVLLCFGLFPGSALPPRMIMTGTSP